MLLPPCCCALGMILVCGTSGPAATGWSELGWPLPAGSWQLPMAVATSPLQVID